MTQNPPIKEMFCRLLKASGQTRAAKTVELFGWLILLESPFMLFAPDFVASLLHLPSLTEQSANYFRLIGLLVGGLGMLYVISARLNAQGFVFASLLDRPLVPIVMGMMWYYNVIPAPLAIAFSVQDFGSFLFTLHAWTSSAPPSE